MSVLSVLSWKSSQGWSIQTEKATYFNTFPSAFKLRITKQTMMETIMVHVWWPRNINDERRRVSRLCLSPPRAWTAPRPIPETNAKDTNDEWRIRMHRMRTPNAVRNFWIFVFIIFPTLPTPTHLGSRAFFFIWDASNREIHRTHSKPPHCLVYRFVFIDLSLYLDVLDF